MKAIGALPTEERIQKMNRYQWLWYYFNLKEEEKIDRSIAIDDLDFITWFIDPERSKAVREERQKQREKAESEDTKYKEYNSSEDNEIVNNSFDEEINQYLNGAQFTELPSARGVSSNETREEFFDKAVAIEKFINENPEDTTFNMIPINNKNIKNLNYKDKTERQILNENLDNDLDIIF